MIRRCGLATMVAVVLGFVVVAPASAHVRVTGTDATQGGYGVLTFRVPTESDTASTTAVIIDLPTDTPITSVSVLPVTGWTAGRTVKRLPEPIRTDDGEVDSYVARVSWTADSARYAIEPGEFGMFSISAGPLPDRPSIAFPTTQRYSDGHAVRWDELAAGRGVEPEHPAPVVVLSPAASASASASATPPASSSSRSADGGLTVAALVLAAGALIVAVIALLRSHRTD